MKKTYLILISSLISYMSHAQNAPFSLWGAGLDGSTYQQTVIYSDVTNGLYFDAPLTAAGVKLPVQFNWRGGSIPSLKINPDGNIGIGTASPGATLDVEASSSGGTNYVVGQFSTTNSTHAGSAILRLIQDSYGTDMESNSGTAAGFRYGSYFDTNIVNDYSLATGPYGNINFVTHGALAMTIGGGSQAGNVGIGTADPHGYKLAVNGSAIATSMTVKLYGNWPDYVFKPSYHLPTLEEIKTYINQNHHLPEIPSEQEVAKDGINLGEMNKLLTKKVEELTLYLIEEDKQNKNQQNEIDQLKQQLNTVIKTLNKN